MIKWVFAHLFGSVMTALFTLAVVALIGVSVYYRPKQVGAAFMWLVRRPHYVIIAVAAWAVWSHLDDYAKLKASAVELQAQLDAANTRAAGLQTSINDYETEVRRIERRQREIRDEIAQARVGLDSATVSQEAQHDPVQASRNLSDRYNRLGRMFDDATRFADPDASGSRADPDAGSRVEGRQERRDGYF